MDMDPEIEELKELVRHQSTIIQDTNRVVHKLWRNIWWGRVYTLLWWAVVLGIGGTVYLYYLAPYVESLREFYGSVQGVFENFRPN